MIYYKPYIHASCKVNVVILTHEVAYNESVSYNACKSVITTDSYRSKTTSVHHVETGILEHAPCSNGPAVNYTKQWVS